MFTLSCFFACLCGYVERAMLYQLGLLKEISYYMMIVAIYHLLWESYCETIYILLWSTSHIVEIASHSSPYPLPVVSPPELEYYRVVRMTDF